MKASRIYKKPFIFLWPDPTADGGIAKIKFDPCWDRVPSTKELVNTMTLAYKYALEVFYRI